MTSEELVQQYELGVTSQGRHPCSVCASDIPFNEFPHFHGSDFGKCARQVQYDKVVRPEPIEDPTTLAFLSDGHLHEKMIVDALRAGGVKVDHRDDAPDGVMTDEFVVGVRDNGRMIHYRDGDGHDAPFDENEIIIVGHTDGVINNRFLLECKSVKDWAVANKFKGQKPVPKDYHGQMQCYMNCLGLDGGFLVVKSRHTSKLLKPMFVERDPEFFDKKIAEFRKILGMMQCGHWHKCTAKTSQEKRYCEACKALGK